MEGHDSKKTAADMSDFVQNLLQKMQSRFQTMSEGIVSKIDEMGIHIDDLEQSVDKLRVEIGVEGSPSPSPSPPLSESKQMSDQQEE